VLDGEARPHIFVVFFIILKPPNCSVWNCLLNRPIEEVKLNVPSAGELVSHAAEICTKCTFRIWSTVCLSSSHLAVVRSKGFSSDPERLGNGKHCFFTRS